MKAILISIQPKWCELIARGIIITANDYKGVEIRKTRPAIETPFKCFIYCTKSGAGLMQTVYAPMHEVGREYNNIQLACYKDYKYCKDMRDCVNGKVIGEFVCDEIYEIRNLGGSFMISNDIALTNRIAKESCLDFTDMRAYLGNKGGYAWHISNLKIYNKPKSLNDFYAPCPSKFADKYDCSSDNQTCSYFTEDDEGCFGCRKEGLTRPPQSWCYVEAI